jgi:hypothetical protein
MLVLPNKSIVIWERFLRENKVLVYKYIVQKVKSGIENNTETIPLFKLEDESMRTWIEKENFPITLSNALEVFIKAEEYEYAAKTKKIINMYYINKLINESIEIPE